jgi:branched-chain amino acid transport system substrate-binding protein
MKKLLFIAALLGVLAFIGFLPGRSFERMGERRFEALGHPSQEVLVGVCWPFSVNRDGMADGLQLALEEITAQHLAGSHTIRLVLRDDEYDERQNKRIAVEFADTPEMSAVIGYYYSPFAVKASTLLESSRLLHIITGANNTGLTSHGFKYIVRTTLSSDKIAKDLARLTTDYGYKKIALLWEEDAFGEDLAYQYRANLDSSDCKFVYLWSYSRERADFRLPVNEIKGIDADVIFFSGLEPWAGDFLREAHQVSLKTPVIGAFIDTPEMRERAGKGLEGSMFFDIYNVESSSPENQAFVRAFRARFGRNPDAGAAQGYDALHLLAKAIKITGSRNPLDLSYAIRYMDPWEGANGLYKFSDTGDLEDKPIFLKKYLDGEPVLVEKDPLSNLGK